MKTSTKPLTPEALCDLIYASGREPVSYSGRFMFGEHCVAVHVDRFDDCSDLPQAGIRWDSLGMDRIAYWPSMTAPEALA